MPEYSHTLLCIINIASALKMGHRRALPCCTDVLKLIDITLLSDEVAGKFSCPTSDVRQGEVEVICLYLLL